MANYTVFDNVLDDKKIIKGDALSILEKIRAEIGKENKEIADMSVNQYAKVLLKDATYFLREELLDALKEQKFDSIYDRALTYLNHMPTSGVKIISYESSPSPAEAHSPERLRRRKVS